MNARSLARELAVRLGDKANVDGTAVQAIVQHGDAWLAIRVRVDPTAEIFVATRPLAGFTLAIRWGDRWGDPDIGDRAFDDAFALSTNDKPLMRLWLDDESRRALLGSTYEYETGMYTGDGSPLMTRRTWTYELANDELVATKGTFESDADRFMIAIRTACTIGARSQRWAAGYADLARAVGGHAASEVEIGGVPVLTATRSSIEVAMQLVRIDGTLRTVIRAPRVGEARLVLARKDPRAGTKFPSDVDGYTLRASDPHAAAKLDDLAKKLVRAARPERVAVDADSVDVWFEGAVAEYAQLDAAVALAAHLAVDAIAAQGPYR